MSFSEMSSFRRLAEIFNRQLAYDEMIYECGFSVPKKNRRTLNPEIAAWTIQNIKNFNSENPRLQDMITACSEYLELYALESVSLLTVSQT